MKVTFSQFDGAIPRLAEDRLPEGKAALSLNALPKSGAFFPLESQSGTLQTFDAATKTVFRYGNVWFSWASDVDAVKPPLPFDGYDRVYYTGDGYPKVTSNDIATGGSGPYPSSSVRIGLPPPDQPSVGLGTDTGSSFIESRAYRVTWVNRYGEEGPPSPASLAIDVPDGSHVIVMRPDLPTAPEYDSSSFIGWRVYRTVTTVEGLGGYLFVDDVPLLNTSYTDAAPPSALSEPLMTTDWIEPNANLSGLKAHPGQFLIGFYDNVLCFSEVGAVHAWPPKYQKVLPEQIRGIAVLEDTIAVLTDSQPYVFSGFDPASMTGRRSARIEPCSSKRSIVEYAGFAVYASPNGLVRITQTGEVDLITSGLFTKEQWEAKSPNEMVAGRWQGMYVYRYVDAETNTTAVEMIDPYNPSAVYSFDDVVDGMYSDLAAQTLYTLSSGGLREWAKGPRREAVWRSGVYRLPRRDWFGVIQVFAESYPVSVGVYRDGELVAVREVRSSHPERFAGFRAYNLQVEVAGVHQVYEVSLAKDVSELRE